MSASAGGFRDPRRLWGLARSLAIYHRPWRRGRLDRFYRRFVPAGGLCFDVGAHVGDRTACFRRLGARVVAVEPQPDFDRLLAWLFRNDPQVEVLPLALAAHPGTVELMVSARTPTVTTGSPAFVGAVRAAPSFRGVAWEERRTVPATTLDELIRRHGRPDFLKIDVEGMEAEVLAGLSAPLPALSFEVVPAHLAGAQACLEQLDRLGRWRFNLVRGEELRFREEAWVDRAGLELPLAALAGEDVSGDVYAELVAPR
ncbi:MAG TPA: FkbM family methyltransferase [Geminicoccaceae bacterium]|nr:FkbM family methyltransferase [Geminicoccaceae bacterium]